MKILNLTLLLFAVVSLSCTSQKVVFQDSPNAYNAELAEAVGADEYGMKSYGYYPVFLRFCRIDRKTFFIGYQFPVEILSNILRKY